MKKDNYTTLISKLVTGEIIPEEKRQLEKWMNQSPDHEKYYRRLVLYWEKARQPAPPFFPDIDEKWKEMEMSLGWTRLRQRTGQKSAVTFFAHLLLKIRHPLPAISLAAVLVLMILLLWQPFFYQVITTANKEKQDIILSDGTTVFINSDSRLKVAKKFSDTVREVNLKGEAFFRVTADKRPFIVITENAQTTVLGTEFNVWARDMQTRVFVKEGRVRLRSLFKESDHTLLSRGQMCCVVNDTLSEVTEKTDINHVLGWLTNKLVFDKMPFGEVIEEVMRYYDIKIVVIDPDLLILEITALFDDEPVDVVLSSICLAVNAKYRLDKGKYYIEKKETKK